MYTWPAASVCPFKRKNVGAVFNCSILLGLKSPTIAVLHYAACYRNSCVQQWHWLWLLRFLEIAMSIHPCTNLPLYFERWRFNIISIFRGCQPIMYKWLLGDFWTLLAQCLGVMRSGILRKPFQHSGNPTQQWPWKLSTEASRLFSTILLEIVDKANCSSKDRATGGKGPATKLELRTYALLRSFSHKLLVPVEILHPRHPILWAVDFSTISNLYTSSRILSDTHREIEAATSTSGSQICAHASQRWACYHHTAHSTSLKARVLSGCWIAAHLWPVLKGNWGQGISTGTDSLWLKLRDRV